jgi:hypothetical protein
MCAAAPKAAHPTSRAPHGSAQRGADAPMSRGYRPKRTRNEKIVIFIGILVVLSMVLGSVASIWMQ